MTTTDNQLRDAARIIKHLRAQLEQRERALAEPIAVVGIGCRFPGDAVDATSFWRLVHDGVDAVTEIPADRFRADDHYSSERDVPGKSYTRWGAFLPDVKSFDAKFFGISPFEADRMDPQQRLALELGWEALEDAGIPPLGLAGTNASVFMGVTHGDYHSIVRGQGLIDAYTGTGNNSSVLAGRLSYFLGFQGPSISVNTACSSSLVAVHMACQSLRLGETGLALAGGVNLILTPEGYVAYSRAHMLSPDRRCKTFDDGADGYVRGEGGGIIALKRLSDALRDGNRIHAVIRGSAINQDGHSASLTAPNGPSQQAVLRAALQNAGVKPHEIGYIEAHGTGTPLGDPIEVQALGAVLGEGRDAKSPFYLASVKTNIGHLEGAAGIAGLIKAALCLKHGQMPAHLHFTKPNAHVPWEEIPAVIPTATVAWDAPQGRRYAGVSSFGFSGTNAHVVLEGPPVVEASDQNGAPPRPTHIVTVSGKSDEALSALADRYAKHLGSNPQVDIADFAYSANSGRTLHSHRATVHADNARQLTDRLRKLAQGDETDPAVVRGVASDERPKIAFLFTGQGSQYAGMAKQLYGAHPTFRASLDRCAERLRPQLDKPLLDVMFGPEDPGSDLYTTRYAQPGIFAIQRSLVELWRSWGVEPSYVMGHSLGEYAAAVTAGIVDADVALDLVAKRGALMQALPERGDAAAIVATESRVREAIGSRKDVEIGAINGPDRILVTGSAEGVRAVVNQFVSAGIEARLLSGMGGAHSYLVEPMLAAFETAGKGIKYQPATIPIVSTALGRVADNELRSPEYWIRQVRQPVRFLDGMRALEAEGCRIFVEIGPRHTLLRLGQTTLTGPEFVWYPSLSRERSDLHQMLDALGQLVVRGVDIDWRRFDEPWRRKVVSVPSYAFDRKRHWIPERSTTSSEALSASGDLLGRAFRSASGDVHFEARVDTESLSFLEDHRLYHTLVMPGAGHMARVVAAGVDGLSAERVELSNVIFTKPLVLRDGESRTSQMSLLPEGGDGFSFKIQSTAGIETAPASWLEHARGELRVVRSADVPRAKQDIDASKAGRAELSGEAFHRRLIDWGYHLGPTFQWVDHMWITEGSALTRMRRPRDADESRYPIHPGLLDACLQTAMAVPDGSGEELSADAIFVPLSVDKLRWFARPGADQLFVHIALRRGEAATEIRVADLELFDETGRVLMTVEGLRLKRAPRGALIADAGEDLRDALHDVSWQPIAVAPGAEGSARRTFLVLADNHGLANEVARQLADRGHAFVIAQAGDAFENLEGMYCLPAGERSGFERLVREAEASLGPLDGVLHTWGLNVAHGDALDVAGVVDAQTMATASVLCAAQAWLATSRPKTQFVVVTRDAQPVRPTDSVSGIAQSPTWGLVRTLASEHPDVRFGLVDLDPSDDPMVAASALVDRLLATDESEFCVARRGGQTWAPRLVTRKGSKAGAPRIDGTGTYVVTGASGALGTAVSHWLVANGAKKILLLQRNADRASTLVKELSDAGADVRALSVDVTNGPAVRDALRESAPQLRGIFHAAGVVADDVVARQSTAGLLDVLAPKLVGTMNLAEATADAKLDFFILFSSVSALLGTAGQANYAAANAFLDAYAYRLRRRGAMVTSVAWGPWQGAGMAANLTQDLQRRLGVIAFTPSAGLRLAADILGERPPYIVAARFDWQHLSTTTPTPSFAGLTADLPRGGSKPERATKPNVDFADRYRSASADERPAVIQSFVLDVINGILGREPNDPVNPTDRLNQLGVDSLLAIDIVRALQARLGLTLPSTLVFERPTVQSMVEYLGKELQPKG